MLKACDPVRLLTYPTYASDLQPFMVQMLSGQMSPWMLPSRSGLGSDRLK